MREFGNNHHRPPSPGSDFWESAREDHLNWCQLMFMISELNGTKLEPEFAPCPESWFDMGMTVTAQYLKWTTWRNYYTVCVFWPYQTRLREESSRGALASLTAGDIVPGTHVFWEGAMVHLKWTYFYLLRFSVLINQLVVTHSTNRKRGEIVGWKLNGLTDPYFVINKTSELFQGWFRWGRTLGTLENQGRKSGWIKY